MGVVEKLLEKGASTEVQDKNGFTALMRASQKSHWRVVTKLKKNRKSCSAMEELRGATAGAE